MSFLITTKQEMRETGIDRLDVIIVSGDAYVDHPAFGAAMIGRALQDHGFSVGIIAQPDWRSPDDFACLGTPRLFFGVTAGNVDSMLAHYTPARKLRSDDAYSPGGKPGRRPNRAAIVYSNRIREACPGTPIILGGIEASLRRLAHYDFWQDKVRRSILLDAKADLIVYGMGESQILETARRLNSGESLDTITDIPGTVYHRPANAFEPPADALRIPSCEEVADDKSAFAAAFKTIYLEQDPHAGRPIVQPSGNRLVIQNPPAPPLTTEQLDRLYELPFERRAHPGYDAEGGVPAVETVRFSIVSHRGCYGDCSFCALTFHQGRTIQNRSVESVLREVEQLRRLPEWRGIISDLGGPTANMYGTGCKRIGSDSRDSDTRANQSPGSHCRAAHCRARRCLGSSPCPNLQTDPAPVIKLLRAVRNAPGVRKVFVASGVRHDLCLADRSGAYLRELCEHHVGGRLKIAPEHVSVPVLAAMGKPGVEALDAFRREFDRVNRALGKRQYLVCYFMSSHPGCGMKEMRELSDWLRRSGIRPEQVQDFYPCPMTLSSCMYHTGLNPLTGESIAAARTDREKQQQRHMMNKPGKKASGAKRQPRRDVRREA